MKKKVKGGILKHYCDKCGKLLYDDIPKVTESPIMLFGMVVPEYKRKTHNEYRHENGCIKRNIKAGDYCVECHETMWAK